jgi:competence protein ComEC
MREACRREIVAAFAVVLLLTAVPAILGGCTTGASESAGLTNSTQPARVGSAAPSPKHSKSAKPRPKKSPQPKPSRSATPKVSSRLAAAPAGEPAVRIVFVNVGQGDAEIIKAGGFDCLIDGGPSGESGHLESELRQTGINRLDLLLVTHPHADHIGDLSQVIADYRPSSAIVDEGATTASYAHLRSALAAAGAHVVRDFRGQSLRMGPVSARVLSPGGLSGDLNADSVVLLLDTYGKRFLFTGDCTGANEEAVGELLARGPPLYLLKVAHHGSASSTSSDFLSETRPRYAVIEVGANSYGHPASATIARLRAAGVRIYSTQRDGDIALTISASGAVAWHFSRSSAPVSSGVGGGSDSSSSSTVTGSASGSTIVYITNTGQCYHRDGCRYLSHSKIPIALAKAKAEGYRPCKVCRPPQ